MILVAALALLAPDYLTTVVSEPVPAAGTVAEITARAEGCAARILSAGVAGGQVVLSSDQGSGVVVANNWVEYRDGLLPWKMRSRVTIEAREGRFRITHNSIERLNEQSFGAQVLGASPWAPVGKWRGSGWQKAEAALIAVSDSLSSCITQASAPSSDW